MDIVHSSNGQKHHVTSPILGSSAHPHQHQERISSMDSTSTWHLMGPPGHPHSGPLWNPATRAAETNTEPLRIRKAHQRPEDL